MAIKKIYVDVETDQGVQFFINKDGLLFLEAGILNDDSGYYSGWVCLDKDDVTEMIKDLHNLVSKMP
jgi:hypothetical protein